MSCIAEGYIRCAVCALCARFARACALPTEVGIPSSRASRKIARSAQSPGGLRPPTRFALENPARCARPSLTLGKASWRLPLALRTRYYLSTALRYFHALANRSSDAKLLCRLRRCCPRWLGFKAVRLTPQGALPRGAAPDSFVCGLTFELRWPQRCGARGLRRKIGAKPQRRRPSVPRRWGSA
jgi:hypothetical protein